MYKLNPKFYGKMVMDSRGQHALTEFTTQKELKDLFILGHTDKISIVEDEKPKESIENTSSKRTSSNRRKQKSKRKED